MTIHLRAIVYANVSLQLEVAFLINHFKSRVRNQCFRDADAFRRLIVLQQGGDDARQGQCRTVQRMAEFGFLVLCAVTAFQAVGLVGIEVGDGANFQPAFLGFGVHLEVEAEGGREAHVSAAEAKNTMGSSGLSMRTNSTLENSCRRFNPRTSFP